MPLSFFKSHASPPEQYGYQLSIRFTATQRAFLDEVVSTMNRLRDPASPPKSVSDVIRYMVDDAFAKCLDPIEMLSQERLNG